MNDSEQTKLPVLDDGVEISWSSKGVDYVMTRDFDGVLRIRVRMDYTPELSDPKLRAGVESALGVTLPKR